MIYCSYSFTPFDHSKSLNLGIIPISVDKQSRQKYNRERFPDSLFREKKSFGGNTLSYKTKQKEILISYFKSKAGTHITAGDVCEHCRAQGENIGQSTVYRQLEKLVDEGIINKYIIDPASPACFEYVGEDSHADADVCFHCKCEKCGKLIHMHCDELEEMGVHIMKEHNFQVDPVRTVIYGLCEDCR